MRTARFGWTSKPLRRSSAGMRREPKSNTSVKTPTLQAGTRHSLKRGASQLQRTARSHLAPQAAFRALPGSPPSFRRPYHFCVHFLQDVVLHTKVGDDALEPRVLPATGYLASFGLSIQSPQRPCLGHIHPFILTLPSAVGAFADVVGRAHRSCIPVSLDLSWDPADLLLAASTPFYLLCSS
jgi:hypothetical protein